MGNLGQSQGLGGLFGQQSPLGVVSLAQQQSQALLGYIPQYTSCSTGAASIRVPPFVGPPAPTIDDYGSYVFWAYRDRLEAARNKERLEDWHIKLALGGWKRL